MSRIIAKMYKNSSDILNEWMEKLFPDQNQGCINFGYWKGIKNPLTKTKRVQSQKKLYMELFDRLAPNCQSVLEVGCGRGHGVAWLMEKGYEAFGLDVLPSQIKKCQKGYPSLASRYYVGKAEQIPFDNNSFDSVCSLEAMQHFTSFKRFCQESFRVLKSGGKLLVSTYFLKDKAFIKDLEKIIPNNFEGFHNALPVSEAVKLIKLSGLHVDAPPFSIGEHVFPFYSQWQKKQLGDTSHAVLSEERRRWADYYTGGGKKPHPWHIAFIKGWVDYYILEGRKI